MASAAPASRAWMAGSMPGCPARSVRVRRMNSPQWPVMADASALRRHDAEFAAGDQRAWLANATAAWRSRSEVIVIPSQRPGTGSGSTGGRRDGDTLAGMEYRRRRAEAGGGCCRWADSIDAPAIQIHRLATCIAMRAD